MPLDWSRLAFQDYEIIAPKKDLVSQEMHLRYHVRTMVCTCQIPNQVDESSSSSLIREMMPLVLGYYLASSLFKLVVTLVVKVRLVVQISSFSKPKALVFLARPGLDPGY